jgi:soluble cytochrome b562
MIEINDDLLSSLLRDMEELQEAANELEKELQLSSNGNMEKIKTTVLRLQTFFNVYRRH